MICEQNTSCISVHTKSVYVCACAYICVCVCACMCNSILSLFVSLPPPAYHSPYLVHYQLITFVTCTQKFRVNKSKNLSSHTSKTSLQSCWKHEGGGGDSMPLSSLGDNSKPSLCSGWRDEAAGRINAFVFTRLQAFTEFLLKRRRRRKDAILLYYHGYNLRNVLDEKTKEEGCYTSVFPWLHAFAVFLVKRRRRRKDAILLSYHGSKPSQCSGWRDAGAFVFTRLQAFIEILLKRRSSRPLVYHGYNL